MIYFFSIIIHIYFLSKLQDTVHLPAKHTVFPRTFLKEGGIVFGKKSTTVPGMAV